MLTPILRKIRPALRWTFTLLGTATLVHWVLVNTGVSPGGPVFRVVVLPMYAMGLLIAAAKVAIWGAPTNSAPDSLSQILTIPLLLTPYVLLDLIVRWLSHFTKVIMARKRAIVRPETHS